jgi:hypothetical protein
MTQEKSGRLGDEFRRVMGDQPQAADQPSEATEPSAPSPPSTTTKPPSLAGRFIKLAVLGFGLLVMLALASELSSAVAAYVTIPSSPTHLLGPRWSGLLLAAVCAFMAWRRYKRAKVADKPTRGFHSLYIWGALTGLMIGSFFFSAVPMFSIARWAVVIWLIVDAGRRIWRGAKLTRALVTLVLAAALVVIPFGNAWHIGPGGQGGSGSSDSYKQPDTPTTELDPKTACAGTKEGNALACINTYKLSANAALQAFNSARDSCEAMADKADLVEQHQKCTEDLLRPDTGTWAQTQETVRRSCEMIVSLGEPCDDQFLQVTNMEPPVIK